MGKGDMAFIIGLFLDLYLLVLVLVLLAFLFVLGVVLFVNVWPFILSWPWMEIICVSVGILTGWLMAVMRYRLSDKDKSGALNDGDEKFKHFEEKIDKFVEKAECRSSHINKKMGFTRSFVRKQNIIALMMMLCMLVLNWIPESVVEQYRWLKSAVAVYWLAVIVMFLCLCAVFVKGFWLWLFKRNPE
ncbi:TPA: hypothetical protein ACFP41_000993 [Neisseria weaveri]